MKEKNLKEQDNLSGKEKTCIFKKKEIWISGIIGLVLGAVLIYVFAVLGILGLSQDKTLISFKGGKVTENDLYNEIKNYGLNYALELADKEILNDKYELTNEQKEEVKEEADSILAMYQMYGYTEEAFLSENGFESKDDFVEYMEFDYKRNLACLDYFKTLIPAEDIENYYNENITFGEINTKHILVQTTDGVKEKDALAKANEIIAKLNEGTSFDDVANEYADSVISEEVDFDSTTASTLAEEYVEASKNLEKDTYTKEAIKTSFGYHIIYCVNKADKPSLEESTNNIVEILSADLEAQDEYIRYKALIKLREDNKLKFKDDKLAEDYEEYCKQVGYIEEEDEEVKIENLEPIID